MADSPFSTTAPLARWSVPTNGIAGGYTGHNKDILRAMVAFSAIAWYNCIELIFLICLRFKRRRGLYFSSLMITSWAIVIYQIGSYGKMSNMIPGDSTVMTVLTNVGWIVMITGNSLVLYSRLHLLCSNPTLLRCVLYGIIINSICMYIPTTALDFGANVVHPGDQRYVDGYAVMERIQMTMFTVQEFVISGIYLYEAYCYLKVTCAGDRRSRNIMYELFAVNVIIILLDIALLAVAHKDLFQIEITFKGFVYSVKLKLELGVLSRLVNIVTSSGSALGRTATFDNDLANMGSDPKAFEGLDFCTSPFPEKPDRSSKSSNDSIFKRHKDPINSPSQGFHRQSSVPWLMTNARSLLVDSGPITPSRPTKRFRREGLPFTPSPQPPPAIYRASTHSAVHEMSFANSEFLTSAAVTEGANDETNRQFQQEIEAELGRSGPSLTERLTHHPRVPGSEETLTSISTGRHGRYADDMSPKADGEEDISPKDTRGMDLDEPEWARHLGVLGRHVRGELDDSSEASPSGGASRDSSLVRSYPGRITGENG